MDYDILFSGFVFFAYFNEVDEIICHFIGQLRKCGVFFQNIMGSLRYLGIAAINRQLSFSYFDLLIDAFYLP